MRYIMLPWEICSSQVFLLFLSVSILQLIRTRREYSTYSALFLDVVITVIVFPLTLYALTVPACC